MKDNEYKIETKSLANVLIERSLNILHEDAEFNVLISEALNGDYNEAYRKIISILNSQYPILLEELSSNNTFIAVKNNTTGHNLEYPSYIKFEGSVVIRQNIEASVSLNDKNDDFNIILEGSNANIRFNFKYAEFNKELGGFVEKGQTRPSTNVPLRDLAIVENQDVNIIKYETLHKKKKQLEQQLETKLKELDVIKQELNSNSFLMSFMKSTSISVDTVGNIKTNMIIEAISKKDTDETSDLKTNIMEIINLEP